MYDRLEQFRPVLEKPLLYVDPYGPGLARVEVEVREPAPIRVEPHASCRGGYFEPLSSWCAVERRCQVYPVVS